MRERYRLVIGSVAATAIGLTGCGAGGQGTAKPSVSKADTAFLPERFTVTYRPGEPFAYECRVTGETVNCVPPGETLTEGFISWTTVISGALSGPTMTGNATTDIKARHQGNPECIAHTHSSGPVEYIFSADGTLAIQDGPNQWETTYSGNCPDHPRGYSQTVSLWEGNGTWSPSE